MQALECAVLAGGRHAPWAREWLARRRDDRSLRLRTLALCPEDAAPQVTALDEIQADLFRFQVCLLPVDPDNLSWARTALATVRRLTIPHISVSRHLRAEALGDLLQLGVQDFVSVDADGQEIRARAVRALRLPANRAGLLVRPGAPYLPQASVIASESSVAEAALTYRAPACAGASPGIPDTHSTSFRVAKQRLIEQFEVSFLHQSLRRHRGNVTRAAHESEKHRRAFWALLRKHRIDARTYRSQ